MVTNEKTEEVDFALGKTGLLSQLFFDAWQNIVCTGCSHGKQTKYSRWIKGSSKNNNNGNTFLAVLGVLKGYVCYVNLFG